MNTTYGKTSKRVFTVQIVLVMEWYKTKRITAKFK